MTKAADKVPHERSLGEQYAPDFAMRVVISELIALIAGDGADGMAVRQVLTQRSVTRLETLFGPELSPAFREGLRERGRNIITSIVTPVEPLAPERHAPQSTWKTSK
jgi:hypothetical protein